MRWVSARHRAKDSSPQLPFLSAAQLTLRTACYKQATNAMKKAREGVKTRLWKLSMENGWYSYLRTVHTRCIYLFIMLFQTHSIELLLHLIFPVKFTFHRIITKWLYSPTCSTLDMGLWIGWLSVYITIIVFWTAYVRYGDNTTTGKTRDYRSTKLQFEVRLCNRQFQS